MNGSRSIGRMAIGGALGVVLAITATQAWQATAAPGDADSTFVPVQPCRLLDMRPGTSPEAGKKTPLEGGVANVFTQQVTGNVGSCVGIPSDAVAVSMNVTITNPTAQSFLTVFPADQALPNASNLNWVASGSPTPNKVDVRLSTDGKIKFFNETGSVNVIADVVGYYTRSSLTELNTRLAAVEAVVGSLDTTVNRIDNEQPVAAYNSLVTEVGLPVAAVSDELVVSPASQQLTVTINAPTAGTVTVVAHATAKEKLTPPQPPSGLPGRLVCQISSNPSATSIDGQATLGIASPVSSPNQPTLGTNRTFDVTAGPNTFGLICAATGDSPNTTIHYRSMSAIFTPTFTPNG